MPTVQAIVDVQYPQLAGVFDLGDKVEIKPKLKKDIEISYRADYDRWDKCRVSVDANGEYVGYTVKSKNGVTYDDKDFYRLIGYRSLSEIFSKIN